MFYRTNIIGSKALFVLYSKVITKISGIQVVSQGYRKTRLDFKNLTG